MNRTVLRNLVGAIGGARAMALSRSATSSEGRSTFGRAALAAAVGSSAVIGGLAFAEAKEAPADVKLSAAAAAAAAAEATPVVIVTDPEQPPKPARPSFIQEDGSIRMTYVLVGGGTASYSAMKAILSRDKDAQILIISDEDATPYARPPLSKELWLQDEAMAQTLRYKDWSGQERSLFYEDGSYYTTPEGPGSSNVVLLKGRRAVRLNVEAQFLVLDNGQKVHYKKVLLATGGTPRSLPQVRSLPAETRARVSTYRSVADFERLSAVARESTNMVVIGGGFLGSELSYALQAYGRSHGLQVTQIFPEEGNMGLVFPRYLSTWTSNKMRQEGISLMNKARVKSLSPKEGDLTKVIVTLEDGRTVEADHVVVAVGIEPNIELARQAGLEMDEKNGGILVNAELESRTNVFAAGDVTSYHDIALGRRRVEHYDHAVLTGRAAGENMAGARRPYRHQSMFWSDLGPKIGYEAVGIVDSRLQTVGVWAKASASDNPQAATASSDNIRSAQHPTQLQDSDKEDASAKSSGQAPAAPAASQAATEEYGKGVVFYLRDRRVVGVLLWNHFGQVSLARRIIREGKRFEDLNELARLFKLHEKH